MSRSNLGIAKPRFGKALLTVALAASASSCPSPFRPDILSALRDAAAPVVSFTSPGSGSVFKSAITLSGAVADYDQEGNVRTGAASSYINGVAYSILGSSEDAEEVSLADDGTFSIDLATASLRTQITVIVEATDLNGNAGSASITLLPDADGPFLALTSPANYSDYASLITLSGYVRDSSSEIGISELRPTVEYQMPGTDIQGTLALDASGAFSGILDVSSLTGSRSIEVTAYDLNGNATRLIVTVKKPDSGGDISGFSVAPGNKSVTVSWSPVEGASSYTLEESEYRITVEGLTDGDSPYVLGGLGNGSRYSFTLTAVFDDTSLNAQSVPIEAIPLSSRTLAPRIKEDSYDYIEIEWNAFYDIPRYTIERRELPWGDFQILTKVTSSSYRDYGVERGVAYEYRVAPSSDQDASSEAAAGTPARFVNAPFDPIAAYGSTTIMDAEAAGDLLYVISHTGYVMVIDISDREQPSTLKTYTAQSQGSRMALSGTDVFVAGGTFLYIVDATNPTTTEYRSRYYEFGLEMQGLAVVGDYAYVAAGAAGLVVFDVGERSVTPIKRATLNTAGTAKAVAVHGNYAYIADGDSGFVVANISNPLAPTQAYAMDNGTASDVALSADGRSMYLAAGSAGAMLYDVSAPTAPVYKGAYNTPGTAVGVSVAGSCAYVSDYDSGLAVIDFYNPASPRLLRSFGLTGGLANQTAIADDYAYVAAQSGGLRIINIYPPTSPSIEGSYDTAGHDYGIDVAGAYAYVADGSAGLSILDVSDPATPLLVAICDTPGSAKDVEVMGSYAYVSDESWLTVIDVSTPSAPRLVGVAGTGGQSYGLAVSGDNAYVTTPTGVLIFDVSDPSSPAAVASWPTASQAQSVDVSGDYAYVMTTFHGLIALDVADPAKPKKAGDIVTPGYAYDIAVSGGYAYVAANDSGLVIVDVSDPASPSIAATFAYTASPSARGVDVSGEYAYVADSAGGLYCFDVHSPSAPFALGAHAAADAAKVKVAGRFAFVARSYDIMSIVDLREAAY